MSKEITRIEVIPFPVLFVRSLAKDYDDQNISWMELYSDLFIKGTDIYREMRVTLASYKIRMKDTVSYEDTFKITESTKVVFELCEEDNGRRILTHGNTREETIVPKKVSTKIALAKMGFTERVKKITD